MKILDQEPAGPVSQLVNRLMVNKTFAARLVPNGDPSGGGGSHQEHEERGCESGHPGHVAQCDR